MIVCVWTWTFHGEPIRFWALGTAIRFVVIAFADENARSYCWLDCARVCVLVALMLVFGDWWYWPREALLRLSFIRNAKVLSPKFSTSQRIAWRADFPMLRRGSPRQMKSPTTKILSICPISKFR